MNVAAAFRSGIRPPGWLISRVPVSVVKPATALLDQAVCSVTTLMLFVAVARFDGPAGVAAFALALTLLTPLRILQDRVLATPYMMRLRGVDAAGGLDASTGNLIALSALGGVAAMGVAMVAATIAYLVRGGDSLTATMAVMALTGPMILMRDLLRCISFAHLRPNEALAIDSVVLIVQTAILVILYAMNLLHAAPILVAAGVASAVGCVIWQRLNFESIRVRRNQFGSDARANWRMAKWLVAGRIFGSAGLMIVPWIIVAMRGDAAAGIYATCMNLVGLSLMFARGLNNYFRPRAIASYRDHGSAALRRDLWRMAIIVGGFMAVVAAGLGIGGDVLMVQIYGAEFIGHRALLLALAIASLATCFSMVGDNGAMAIHRVDVAFYAEVANGIVAIVLTPILLGYVGLPGAAIAVTAGQMVGAVILLSVVVRNTRRATIADDSSTTADTMPGKTWGSASQ